ncbi:MAG TPA: type III-A CRISPR-associated protein Csm2 [Planctomycetota bacterium]|jgi:CRISPR type III-A-associated protein Csm2|nr:type III-A CRISPR-associated protein Csm2 [Planctomycetota bacterium]
MARDRRTDSDYNRPRREDIASIVRGDNPNATRTAAELAHYLCKGSRDGRVRVAQLRSCFTVLKNLEKEIDEGRITPAQAAQELDKARVRLAFEAGRTVGFADRKMRDLMGVFGDLVGCAQEDLKAVRNLIQFFESVLAFQRFHGG